MAFVQGASSNDAEDAGGTDLSEKTGREGEKREEGKYRIARDVDSKHHQQDKRKYEDTRVRCGGEDGEKYESSRIRGLCH